MWLYDFVKWTGYPLTWLIIRTKRHFIGGKKDKDLFKGKFIVASNHLSYWDPFTAISVIPGRRVVHMATKKLFQKWCGWFFKAVGIIEIDNHHLSTKAFRKAKNTLDRGHIVCMFPEGSVSLDNELHEYKSGAVMLSALAKADILPIYLGKRKTFVQRKVAIVGHKLKYQDLFKSEMPTKEEIIKATSVLMEKEKELENRFKELYEKR